MGQAGESNIYAAMTWDMMIALALAIEATGSTNMTDVNKNIRTVANAPGTKVHSFAEGKAKLKAGKIDYDGASSILDFDESGDITPGFRHLPDREAARSPGNTRCASSLAARHREQTTSREGLDLVLRSTGREWPVARPHRRPCGARHHAGVRHRAICERVRRRRPELRRLYGAGRAAHDRFASARRRLCHCRKRARLGAQLQARLQAARADAPASPCWSDRSAWHSWSAASWASFSGTSRKCSTSS